MSDISPDEIPANLTADQIDFVFFYCEKDREKAEQKVQWLRNLGFTGCLYDDKFYLDWIVSLGLDLADELSRRASINFFMITKHLVNDPNINFHKGAAISSSLSKQDGSVVPIFELQKDDFPEHSHFYGWRTYTGLYPTSPDKHYKRLFEMTGTKQRKTKRKEEQEKAKQKWIEKEKVRRVQRSIYEDRESKERRKQQQNQFAKDVKDIPQKVQSELAKESAQNNRLPFHGFAATPPSSSETVSSIITQQLQNIAQNTGLTADKIIQMLLENRSQGQVQNQQFHTIMTAVNNIETSNQINKQELITLLKEQQAKGNQWKEPGPNQQETGAGGTTYNVHIHNSRGSVNVGSHTVQPDSTNIPRPDLEQDGSLSMNTRPEIIRDHEPETRNMPDVRPKDVRPKEQAKPFDFAKEFAEDRPPDADSATKKTSTGENITGQPKHNVEGQGNPAVILRVVTEMQPSVISDSFEISNTGLSTVGGISESQQLEMYVRQLDEIKKSEEEESAYPDTGSSGEAQASTQRSNISRSGVQQPIWTPEASLSANSGGQSDTNQPQTIHNSQPIFESLRPEDIIIIDNTDQAEEMSLGGDSICVNEKSRAVEDNSFNPGSMHEDAGHGNIKNLPECVTNMEDSVVDSETVVKKLAQPFGFMEINKSATDDKTPNQDSLDIETQPKVLLTGQAPPNPAFQQVTAIGPLDGTSLSDASVSSQSNTTVKPVFETTSDIINQPQLSRDSRRRNERPNPALDRVMHIGKPFDSCNSSGFSSANSESSSTMKPFEESRSDDRNPKHSTDTGQHNYRTDNIVRQHQDTDELAQPQDQNNIVKVNSDLPQTELESSIGEQRSINVQNFNESGPPHETGPQSESGPQNELTNVSESVDVTPDSPRDSELLVVMNPKSPDWEGTPV